MAKFNPREALYFGIHHFLAGSSLGEEYLQIREEDERREYTGIADQLLSNLLIYSLEHVPYYRQSVHLDCDPSILNPKELLAHFPILTKEIIRHNFEQLKSDDLSKRKWVYNTSGGSTGEPLRLIQDRYFQDRQMAIQWLSFHWAGREVGQPAAHLWGSERDILYNAEKLDRRILLKITNDHYLNSFRMTPDKMRGYLDSLNRTSPRLIVAYVQSIYDLARFAMKEGVQVTPQKAIMTSAQTLYPSERQKIEAVFQCQVYDRYGSREVGDIACECSIHRGKHVFPWGNFVEIFDERGEPVPDGEEGEILVTNLNNYAMPLIRYAIGDRGILSTSRQCVCGRQGQMLEEVTGRTIDSFKKADGTLVYGAYFAHLLFFKDWVQKFQVVQKDYNWLVYRIQKTDAGYQPPAMELNEIEEKSKIVMGEGCIIDFEFPEEIQPSPSGKLQYLITEVK